MQVFVSLGIIQVTSDVNSKALDLNFPVQSLCQFFYSLPFVLLELSQFS